MSKDKLSTAILCRTNAPLIKMLFDFIKSGSQIKALIVGREVGRALKDTIAEVIGTRFNPPIKEFDILLESWINQLRDRYAEKDGQSEMFLADCEDHRACLVVLSQSCKDVKELFNKIDTFIVDQDKVDEIDPDTILMCSGHRSKGLEWDRVIVIRPDLCPHPNAKSDEEQEQEENIRYVMFSRAKKEMFIIHDEQPK